MPREDVFDLLSKQRELNFKPGTSFNYCNTGYFLLSQIVERVSGKTLNEYATEKIFTPLGMSSTQFDDNNTTLIRGRANSYRKAGDEWFALMSSLELVGDGALHTTTADMSKWHLALAGNTLSKTLTTKLQTKSTVAGKEFPYAGGLFIDKLSGLDRVQHGGDWLGFNAMASWFPDHKVSVFTFGNDGTQNGKSFNAEAAKLVLAEFITKEEPKAEEETVDEGFEMTDAQFKKLEGRYKLKLGGLVIKVFKDKGKFMAQATGQPSFELAAVSETSVKHSEADITMDFKSEKEGSFTEGTLTQNGMKIPFERLPAFEPTKEQIDALLGHYYSAELELTTEFYLEDGKLMADRNGKNGSEVAWIDENQLSSSGMTLDVKRDEKGRITHILVQAGRALNLRFDRLDI